MKPQQAATPPVTPKRSLSDGAFEEAPAVIVIPTEQAQ